MTKKHIYIIEHQFDMEQQEPFYVFAKDSKEARQKFWNFQQISWEANDTWGDEKPTWSEIKDDIQIISAKRLYANPNAERMPEYKSNIVEPVMYKQNYQEAMFTEKVLRGEK